MIIPWYMILKCNDCSRLIFWKTPIRPYIKIESIKSCLKLPKVRDVGKIHGKEGLDLYCI